MNIIYRDGNKTILVGISYTENEANGKKELIISFKINNTSEILNIGENLRTTGITGQWSFVFVPAAK